MKKSLLGIGLAAVVLCMGTMPVFAAGHGHSRGYGCWMQRINTEVSTRTTDVAVPAAVNVNQMTVKRMIARKDTALPAPAVQQTVSAPAEQQVVSYACATPGCAYTDANGDGICDNCGLNLHCGSGWADANGDGYCDNCGQVTNCAGGMHYGQGAGCGGACVDTNGDGYCDNCGQGVSYGGGYQAGCGGACVDTNGDGYCDNCGQGVSYGGNHGGKHHGGRHHG